MKTYDETFRDRIDKTDRMTVITHHDYKQIQLDAWKQGMLDAVEIASTTESENCSKVADGSPWPSEAIFNAAEAKTSL